MSHTATLVTDSPAHGGAIVEVAPAAIDGPLLSGQVFAGTLRP